MTSQKLISHLKANLPLKLEYFYCHVDQTTLYLSWIQPVASTVSAEIADTVDGGNCNNPELPLGDAKDTSIDASMGDFMLKKENSKNNHDFFLNAPFQASFSFIFGWPIQIGNA